MGEYELDQIAMRFRQLEGVESPANGAELAERATSSGCRGVDTISYENANGRIRRVATRAGRRRRKLNANTPPLAFRAYPDNRGVVGGAYSADMTL